MNSKILVSAELKNINQQYPDRSLVLTNGCFDLLHIGHIYFLAEASKLGDLLLVALNSDKSVRRLKGSGRPVFELSERMEIIAALEMVDLVVSFEEPTCRRVITEVRPDIYVKGGDYTSETLPEAETARRVGAELKFIPLTVERSTSQIIQQIVSSHNREDEVIQ